MASWEDRVLTPMSEPGDDHGGGGESGGGGADDPGNHDAGDDSLVGGSDDGADHDAGDDSLIGGSDDGAGHDAGDDSLVGGSDDGAGHDAGDDSMTGGDDDPAGHDAGDDSLTGGNDDGPLHDQLDDHGHHHVGGHLDDFTVTPTGTGVVITSKANPGATLAIEAAERVHFEDYSVAFDIHGHGGQAYRLYKAAFDRAPDLEGLGYQINDLDHTGSLDQIAANFLASPEFQSLYGNVDDTQFITLLYRNVLDREPEAEGLESHLNELHHGYSRAQVLTFFSESGENQANVIGQIQNGIVFIG